MKTANAASLRRPRPAGKPWRRPATRPDLKIRRRPGYLAPLSQEIPMAGHSQFKNIMFRKGKQDKERSKLFAKLSREITVAAKSGLPDPAHNPRLRTAIIAAKAESMPKDNIERAIQKAVGGAGENYDEVRYEGRGPGGVALIIETMTDNIGMPISSINSPSEASVDCASICLRSVWRSARTAPQSSVTPPNSIRLPFHNASPPRTGVSRAAR